MRIGYIRVSSLDQNTDRQHEILKQYALEKIFEEKVSGKDRNRPALQEMIKFCRDGDTIYIESISRLARNTKDFLNIVEELSAKAVGIVSAKESIDTSTPSGKFMLTVFAALSQLERDTIKQRQQEGINLALNKGVRFGRPRIPRPQNFTQNINEWKAGKITATEAMRKMSLKPGTFYRLVKEMQG
ncbi:recombinase family protein [Anaerosinus gibii]|uniref:Recombinase family protein n=1 Tax=Selenobaculum gibii TaxID=3054208 RepID=A0A9Y2AKK0_9FIRM|nr:recombinase family protein [Selenobaculum gbiensis]WIW71876.1 recombinase family protein [Selenobaculum gbiensis]